MMNRILPSPILALLLCAAALPMLPVATPARADETPAAGYCAQNPQACADAAERIRKRCADDPAACEQVRDRLQQAKAKCEADPAACNEKKEQFREKRDALKARCEADPAACEQKKQEFRERLRDRRRDKVSPAGDTPPIITPKPAS